MPGFYSTETTVVLKRFANFFIFRFSIRIPPKQQLYWNNWRKWKQNWRRINSTETTVVLKRTFEFYSLRIYCLFHRNNSCIETFLAWGWKYKGIYSTETTVVLKHRGKDNSLILNADSTETTVVLKQKNIFSFF